MSKNNLMVLRRLHGKFHDAKEQFLREHETKELIKRGHNLSLLLEKSNLPVTEDYPIDFVVLWVDGNDPEWIAEKQKYMGESAEIKDNNHEARWRNWDNLQYWFRAVEKYAPWVRYIYFVTWGHIPKWLNTENPKLKIINHKDYIPHEYLPTFCTCPIEMNLWRIPGLSENFIFFNDDVFLAQPVEKSDFFYKGLPKYCAIAIPEYPTDHMTTWEHKKFNVAGVINSRFNVKESIQNNPEKWFSYKYSKFVKYNIRAYEDGCICGMFYPHVGIPCRVSTMKEVWESVGELLDKSCMNKFRTMGALIFQLFEVWEMFKGTFEPVDWNYYGFAGNVVPGNLSSFEEFIAQEKGKMICINDSEQLKSEDFEKVKNTILHTFESKFPQKSTFEL